MAEEPKTWAEGALPHFLVDTPEGEHGFKRVHVSLLHQMAGSFAIDYAKVTDFRMRRQLQAMEFMCREIADRIAPFVPEPASPGAQEP